MPVEELCTYCHTIQLNKKMLHGPLAAGGCRVCHSPHGSPYKYFLVSEPREFCLHCHHKKDIEKNEVHTDVEAECTACHDAHASDNAFLLK
jgi:predicted CXXCH cytochrome family protein